MIILVIKIIPNQKTSKLRDVYANPENPPTFGCQIKSNIVVPHACKVSLRRVNTAFHKYHFAKNPANGGNPAIDIKETPTNNA